MFRTSDAEFIRKCGLDAYLFLRYLRMLLKIFAPLCFIVLPVLLPLNAAGGKDTNYQNATDISSPRWNVTGLDQLAWGNVTPHHTQRYWGHLVVAIFVIVYVCAIFFDELRGYIRLRQAYLTSPQHRLRASATTVLVTSIPAKWLGKDSLFNLYNVFPGGVRNVWINRNMDELNEKVKLRNDLALQLEAAETELIKKCRKVHLKEVEAGQRKTAMGEKVVSSRRGSIPEQDPSEMASRSGVRYANPHRVVGQAVYNDNVPGNAEVHWNEFGRPDERPGPSHSSLADLPGKQRSSESESKSSGNSGTVPAIPMSRQTTAFSGADENAFRRKDKQQIDAGKEYPIAYNDQDLEDLGEPLWRKYIEEKDRETMRLPVFGLSWMPSLWFVGEKVDTIDYCRKEVARLNLEIELDQQHAEKFPRMNSAFVQFNNQAAAHMACQAVSHHLPKQLAPRTVEISPDDVIWDNMSIKWWERYIRTFGVMTLVSAMVVGWAFPVAFTGLLSQLSYLQNSFTWLTWINVMPTWFVSAVQGILPALFLGLLVGLLPVILRFLSKAQGVHTGLAVELTVQNYYFAFLFVQLFLVVSISSSFSTIIDNAADVTSWPTVLAQNIPKSSNYFFSYMILQALSVSAGALVQVFSLVSWFILAPLLDSTARKKWGRTMNLSQIQWGTFFPVYTTLGSIGKTRFLWTESITPTDREDTGLIYCIVAPLILVFNVITFGLFWVVYRYNTLYVTRFKFDTGGLVFPKGINQLFTGVYVMELCLIGLFFLVRDVDGDVACKGQGICMVFVFVLTIGYQILLNEAFDPLIRYLPITLEEDAVKRDEEFQRAQLERMGLLTSESQPDPAQSAEFEGNHDPKHNERVESIELTTLNGTKQMMQDQLEVSSADGRQTWADRRPNMLYGSGLNLPHVRCVRDQLSSDTEAQMRQEARIGRALFAGMHEELEDLTPDEREVLVRRAFQHEALRAKRPVIWIPQDEIGVSDDEVYRTQRFSKHIWISNEYQALDGRCRAIFSRSPPDFSEVDLIQL